MRRLLTVAVLLGLIMIQALPAHALADTDGDLIDDAVDLCPTVADPFQGDLDGDEIGDRCDPDSTTAGTDAADLIIGTSGPDTLSGLDGDDALYGDDGEDTIDGGGGRDFVAGGAGTDRLTGGADCDVFAFDPSGDGDVITDYQPGIDRLLYPPQDDDPTDDGPLVAAFGGNDHLVVTFGLDAATLEFEGLDAGVEIELDTTPCDPPPCRSGWDFAEVGLFVDLALFDELIVLGSPYTDDSLVGTRCDDVIFGDVPEIFDYLSDGLLTDDSIFGLGGMDLLVGDWAGLNGTAVGGNDVIEGGAETDVIGGDAIELSGAAQGGHDLIAGSGGDDILAGDAFVITDEAQGGDDTIYGDTGNDIITGDAYDISGAGMGGNDIIFGGTGSDLITGDTSLLADQAVGGNDMLSGGDGDDVIGGDAGEDMSGSAIGGNDVIDGGSGDDLIYGDSGSQIDDTAVGGADTITGGAGDDILYGDTPSLASSAFAGLDTFIFDATTAFGDDMIEDGGIGGAVDTIRFAGSGLNPDLAPLDSRSTITIAGADVLAVVFTDSTKTTITGSIRLTGIGTVGLSSWQDVDDLATIEVEDWTVYN